MKVCRILALTLCVVAGVAVGQTTAPEEIDFRRAGELHQKSVSGQPMTEEEKAYLERAMAEIRAGRGPGRGHAPEAGGRPVAATAPANGAGPFAVARSIPVAGEGLWGQVTLDQEGKRLYIPHASRIQVLELATGKVVAEIPARGATAVTLVPEAHRGFAISPRDNSVSVFDLNTWESLGTLNVGEEPSCMCYDAATKRVFIGCRGNSSLVSLAPDVDPKTGKAGAGIDLGAKPSAIVSDGQNSLYITLQDTGEVALVDAKESRLLTKWPLAQERGPGSLDGLSLDPTNNRLFIGDRMMRVIVASTVDGRQLGEVTLPTGAQSTAYHDPYAFALCYDGTLAVLSPDPQKGFKLEQLLPTGISSRVPAPRTFALDEKTMTLYIPTMDVDGTGGAPRAVPNSFKILVVQKKEAKP